MPRLEAWHVWDVAGGRRLVGAIYDDTRFPDGRDVITSPLVSGPEKNGEGTLVAKTETGTVYTLGEPSPKQEGV